MGRWAVYNALTTDSVLVDMGYGPDNVFPNFSIDTPDRDLDHFIVFRWGSQNTKMLTRGPRALTVYVHQFRELSESFDLIDATLDRIKTVLTSMTHIRGWDGHTVTSIRYMGDSEDGVDGGYDTIYRDASYEVLSRAS